MTPSARTSKTFCNTALAGAVLAIERFCRYRRGRGNYAIIASCELVTVVGVGAIMLGEKLTPLSALGGGLIFASVLLHAEWVSHPKSFALRLADLSPAHHREVPDGRILALNPQQPATAFETENGRSASAPGTALHAPFPTFTQTSSNHRVGWTTNLRLARTQSVRGRNQTDPDCLRANMPGSRCPNPQRCGHPQIDRLPGSIVRRARHCR